MSSSSHRPVRRVKSGGVECNCEGWTYALIEEDPNQVKWYRPPDAKEQLGNRPALIEYWKQRHDRMPSFLNFRVKDAPEWLERVDDEEEENAKSISCGRSRESAKKGRSRDMGSSKSHHSCSTVTSPARITKVRQLIHSYSFFSLRGFGNSVCRRVELPPLFASRYDLDTAVWVSVSSFEFSN